MIIEETTFGSLLAICAAPIPTTVHRHKDVYFGLAHIGDSIYIAIAKDGPKEKAPYIEYDTRERTWKLVDPAKQTFSRSPTTVTIPVIEVKELSGELGEKIKTILEK
ncbi:MAG: hypothetical protein QMD21_00785 [Candidatus Thermoplasmatota archaeon]|nr:hypothetical protein [Candidatus Thermoplasmatota archaeon]MDI6855306.1 hypothetical protein [Candidatus Thermoplasmatota archaeon]MDI6887443.1 hypothetical protein [Candidatus Thermoplasmatota archaeon]